MRNWPGGESFFKQWLWWQGQNKGHDQDGFNYFVRGQWFHGDNDMPTAVLPKDPGDRLFYAAFHNTTAISFLPVRRGTSHLWGPAGLLLLPCGAVRCKVHHLRVRLREWV